MGNFLLPVEASVIPKLGNFVLLQTGASVLQIGVASFCYKLGQVLLQIGAAFLLQIGASVITNYVSLIITNQGKFYCKSRQLLQIRATVFTNWGKLYYKLGQLLQIRRIITNSGITIIIFHVQLRKYFLKTTCI